MLAVTTVGCPADISHMLGFSLYTMKQMGSHAMDLTVYVKPSVPSCQCEFAAHAVFYRKAVKEHV